MVVISGPLDSITNFDSITGHFVFEKVPVIYLYGGAQCLGALRGGRTLCMLSSLCPTLGVP